MITKHRMIEEETSCFVVRCHFATDHVKEKNNQKIEKSQKSPHIQ